ncbi:Kdo hydroxylase family protein [Serratia fonticola]
MLENKINLQSAITTLPYLDWNATYSATLDAVAELESGKVLYFPHLAFNLTDAEKTLLTPELVDPKRKNISYQPEQQKLTGVALEAKRDLDPPSPDSFCILS